MHRRYLMCALMLLSAGVARVAGAQNSLDTLFQRYPGQTTQEAAALSASFAALGPEAVQQAVQRLAPMGTADDNAPRYALSGLAKYAGSPGHEAERAMLCAALCKALPQVQALDVQQFLIALMEWVGKDDAVPALSGCLATPGLTKPASQALAAIGTPASCAALEAALGKAQGENVAVLIAALGKGGCLSSQSLIGNFEASEDAGVRDAASYALAALEKAGAGRVIDFGAIAALDPRVEEARALLATGKKRKAGAIAGKLLQEAASSESVAAAVEILVKARGQKSLKAILPLLDNDSAAVRQAAIRALWSLDSAKARAAVLKHLETASPLQSAEELRVLGALKAPEVRQAAEARLAHPDLEVRLAAIDALVAAAGTEAFGPLLARREIDGEGVGPEFDALDRALEATTPPLGAPLGPPDAEGFVPLFNGKDLSGWFGETAGYAVEDGALACKTGRKIYAEGDYDDFVLRLDFRLVAESNNGVGIRMAPGTHAATRGMEIQVLDDTAAKYADLKPYQYCGAIYGVVAPERGHLKPIGEWNAMEITALGPQLRVVLNGAVIVDANIAEASAKGTPDEKEHPGLQRKSGRIAFLGHQTEVWFRNIRVKRLAPN